MAIEEWKFVNGKQSILFARLTEKNDRHVIGSYPYVSRGKGCLYYRLDPNGIGEEWCEFDLGDSRWNNFLHGVSIDRNWKLVE